MTIPLQISRFLHKKRLGLDLNNDLEVNVQVQINHCICIEGELNKIPQCSVMGPLIFNIFINDIINATRKFTLIMYVDDTTLVSHLENFGVTNIAIEDGPNQEISKVNTWLLSNKLVLNVAKSKFMLFFKHLKVMPTLYYQSIIIQ